VLACFGYALHFGARLFVCKLPVNMGDTFFLCVFTDIITFNCESQKDLPGCGGRKGVRRPSARALKDENGDDW
jgi:hypothetical protein